MTAPLPAPATHELIDEINSLIGSTTHHLKRTDFVVRKLEKRAVDLASSDAPGSSTALCALAQLCGDVEELKRWARNVKLHGQATRSVVTEMVALCNLGYFSQAASLFNDLCEHQYFEAAEKFGTGTFLAAWQKILSASEFLQRAGAPDLSPEMIHITKSCSDAIGRLHIPESDVQRVLDVAGEVLRERRMFWVGQHPILDVVDDGDGPSILYQLGVPVGVDAAVAMNFEVAERLVDQGVDVPCFGFNFIAMAEREEQAQ